MSSIRERQADQTPMLLGRTRAERLLDGIYQRQKRYILQRRRRAAAEGALRIVLPEEKRRRLLDVLPEPAVTGGDATATHVTAEQRHKVKQQASGPPVGPAAKDKNVEDAVEALQRHLWRHAKFDKAVQLLQQLWQSHFVPETKRCLLAGLLTAASTDNCISSPSGRTEVAALFRNVVEPMLQRECERRKQAELKKQQERIERTTLRAIQFNDRLQCVVVNERRAARAVSAGQPLGLGDRNSGSSGRHVLLPGADAGTRATVAAVAAAAAAAVDRAQQKQLNHSGGRRGSSLQKDYDSITDRAGSSTCSAKNSNLTTAGTTGTATDPTTTTFQTTGPQARSLQLQAGTSAERSGGESEDVRLNDAEKELLEVLRLRCKTHLLLFTDDAFQFNQQVAELRRVFDAMLQGTGEEEEEEGQFDEEVCRREYGSREAAQGISDVVCDVRGAGHRAERQRGEASSASAPVEEAAASPKTAVASIAFSPAAERVQQQNVEREEAVSKPDHLAAVCRGLSKTENTEDGGMKQQMHGMSRAFAEATATSEEAAGPPSSALGALPSAGARPAFEKWGNMTTHVEDLGSNDIIGRKVGENMAATPTFEVESEDPNKDQRTADAVSTAQEAGSSTAPAPDEAEDVEVPTPEERWPLPLK